MIRIRTTQTARFLSLVFVALALGPSLAHLMELPNKIDLPRDQYLVVQQIYRGWQLLGIARWEYSHAAGSVLNLAAFIAVALSSAGEE